jgi:hypothetical protein
LEIALTVPQTEFFVGEGKFKLFCGGFGSGKTEVLILNTLMDLEHFPGANIAVYSPTYDLLRLSLMPRIEEYLIVMGMKFSYNKSEYIFRVHGYGKIIMRSLDRPERIIAYEVFRSHIDELDTLPQKKAEEAWNKIIARNRQKMPILDEDGEIQYFENHDGNQEMVREQNKVSAYTTPEGFRFCYKRWELNTTPDYRVYRAPTYSNPHVGSEYVDALRASYTKELVEAYIEGKFVNLTAGKVYKSYDRKASGSKEIVEGNETLRVGMDFNVQRGCAVIYVPREDGWHAVDEIIDSFDTPETIQILQERYPKNQIMVYPDATGQNRKSVNATETDMSLLRTAGFLIRKNETNPLVKDRIMSVNAKFCNGKGERGLFVNASMCPNLVAGLEQQVYDKNGQPEKGEGKWDDVNDAFGYPIAYEFSITKPVATTTSVVGLH